VEAASAVASVLSQSANAIAVADAPIATIRPHSSSRRESGRRRRLFNDGVFMVLPVQVSMVAGFLSSLASYLEPG